MQDLVMPDDIVTYFDIDLEMQLNESYHTKKSWITRWKKSIHASVHRAKQDAALNTRKFWTFCGRDQAPRFIICHTKQNRVTDSKHSQRDGTLISMEGFQIHPVKRSTSKTTPVSPPDKICGQMS